MLNPFSAKDRNRDPWADFSTELDRCRRYERSFVLVRLTSPSHGNGSMPAGQKSRESEPGLRSMVRQVDRMWSDDGDVYLLLPETDRQQAVSMLARIQREHPEILPDSDHVGMVAFPDDGLTTRALLTQLETPMDRGSRSPAGVEDTASAGTSRVLQGQQD